MVKDKRGRPPVESSGGALLMHMYEVMHCGGVSLGQAGPCNVQLSDKSRLSSLMQRFF